MAKRYRILTYWSGRTDAVPVLAGQIAAFLGAAGALHPALRGFLFQAKGMAAPEPVTGLAACAEALRRSTITWTTGETERTSYAPRFFLERRIDPPVEVTITCGIEPLGLPAWTPNRLDLSMRGDVADERRSRPVLEGLLRSAVSAFRPDFGFAGTDLVPDAPIPLFSDGTPPVGWMTYLSAAYPPIPPALPQPAVAYPIDGQGTLIVAHPDLFRDGDPAHRAAVERVREALKAAGVLVPATEIQPLA
jgi:hypothetical protein